MSAREIIANVNRTAPISYNSEQMADSILTPLREAGYRVLEPGELDPETIERCAVVADKRAVMAGKVTQEAAWALLEAMPDAIRALKGTDHG